MHLAQRYDKPTRGIVLKSVPIEIWTMLHQNALSSRMGFSQYIIRVLSGLVSNNC